MPFPMTTSEGQANPDTVTGAMIIFGTPTRVLFDFGSNRSFVSIAFTLHADGELAPLNKSWWLLHLLENKFSVLRYSRGVKY